MELLLNLLWLTLALPALWIWWCVPAQVRHSSGARGARPFLLLICVLVLLFPVISATDDLHPMRGEMEESNPFKRIVQQASSSGSSIWLSQPHGFLVRAVSDSGICPGNKVCALISPGSFVFPDVAVFSQRDSRAPPFLLPG